MGIGCMTVLKCIILFFNPLLTNGLAHHYQLGELTFIFRDVRSDFFFLILSHFFDEITFSKQNSPRWDAKFCGVTSGAVMFAYSHTERDARFN